MTSILSGQKRKAPITTLVGNFADKLDFLRDIDCNKSRHMQIDISTMYNYQVFKCELILLIQCTIILS